MDNGQHIPHHATQNPLRFKRFKHFQQNTVVLLKKLREIGSEADQSR